MLKINLAFFAQPLHLCLGETGIGGKFAWIQHGKFVEIGDRGLGTVLFDRQDAGHIGCRDNFRGKVRILEPAPEKIEISRLRVFIMLRLADHGIPLINDEDKLPATGILHASRKEII